MRKIHLLFILSLLPFAASASNQEIRERLAATPPPVEQMQKSYQEPYQGNAPHKTPQQIQEELNQDEALFRQALKMFNPWYAGPLITGGATMMPPGMANLQVYFYVNDFYAVFNEDRKTVDTPTKINFNPALGGMQFGVTSWMDMNLNAQFDANWQEHKHSGGWGDSSVGLGFKILKQTLHLPAIKVVFSETVPTGRYKRLNPGKIGLDATGGGSWVSTFGLRVSKLFFWSKLHPTNLRWAFGYSIPTPVKVRGFNSYGGGYGTSGTVRPGNSATVDFAFEYSFTQRWVFACDFVYNWQNSTKFCGKSGTTTKHGTIPAAVGVGSNDSLSFAPAIEYNPNANLNFLGGVWFNVYGRNTGKFVSGIFSVEGTFAW